MSHFVITLTRQFASNGRPIAQAMSQELGIEFYDRDIVEATAARLGLPVREISDSEDTHSGSFFRSLYPLGTGNLSVQDELFQTQSNIIRDLAARESCIIVGRCADAVLHDRTDVFHIRVYAPYDYRMQVCTGQLAMEPHTAKKMIDRIDRSREQYHREYGGCEPDHYSHVLINSSRFTVPEAAKLLCGMVRQYFSLTETDHSR